MAKEFIDKKGSNLVIEHNKTNIIFKTDDKNIKNNYDLKLFFDKDILKQLVNYLEGVAERIWKDFNPKAADSISSDYTEYYDRKYDNNGYLTVFNDYVLSIERPYNHCHYMYKFNKRRMESFIYDLKK